MQSSNLSQPPGSGNPAPLEGVDLWDLVQVTCMSGARRVVQVEATGGAAGQLFFAGGQLVHAILGEQQGESAALALLTMRGGRCDICSRPFPAVPTVHTPWQGLLLRAAQLVDEGRRAVRESGVRRLHVEAADDREPAVVLEDAVEPTDAPLVEILDDDLWTTTTMELELEGMAVSEERPSVSAQDTTLDASEYRQLVWIGADGEVLQEQGDDPAFSGNAAYAARMAELIGDLLSLGEFVALECRDGSCSRIAYADGRGGVVGCVPAAPETATMLRRRLWL